MYEHNNMAKKYCYSQLQIRSYTIGDISIDYGLHLMINDNNYLL